MRIAEKVFVVTGGGNGMGREVVLDSGESERTGALMLEFNKQVNAAIVDPGFITNVRKKLDLDQREAAEIFGGGVNAFSRYENGKTKPPLALVKLLKVQFRDDQRPGAAESVIARRAGNRRRRPVIGARLISAAGP